MSIAAVVTAAGLSRRMGTFKPLLLLGECCLAERTIRSLQLGGAKSVVVVTGYCAEALETKLKPTGAIFVYNENYAASDMFASLCLGLSHVPPDAEGCLFTPVDVPLFLPETVRLLSKNPAEAAVPVYNGRCGHPVYLPGEWLQKIRSYHGDGGLKAAMISLGLCFRPVPVQDEGILQDADTPENYQALLELLQNRR